jgi:hypothetical protein
MRVAGRYRESGREGIGRDDDLSGYIPKWLDG